ncbi:MAG: O-antigen ligase family protein, partial [Candidatus Saccharimonadia bacterium]
LLAALLSLHLGRALAVTSFTLYTAVLAVVVSRIVTPKLLHNMERWLLGGAILACAFAFYQFFGDLIGLPRALTGLRSEYVKAVFGFPRVQSTSLEPLFFAHYLLFPTSLLLSLGLTRKRIKLGILIAFFTCIFLTVSRGGAVAALLLVVAFGGLSLVRKRFTTTAKIFSAIIIGFAISFAMISVIVPAWSSLTAPNKVSKEATAASAYKNHVTNYAEVDNPASDRAKWRNLALELFKSHPVLGVGPGNFGYYANKLEGYPITQTVDNLPLEILAETGVVGATALTLFSLFLLWEAGSALWKGQLESEHSAWIIGTVAFLGATFVQYQTFSTLYIIVVWVAIGIVMGLSSPTRLNLKKS